MAFGSRRKAKAISTNGGTCMYDASGTNYNSLADIHLWVNRGGIADDCLMADVGKRVDDHIVAEDSVLADKGMCTDAHVASQHHSGLHHRSGMYPLITPGLGREDLKHTAKCQARVFGDNHRLVPNGGVWRYDKGRRTGGLCQW